MARKGRLTDDDLLRIRAILRERGGAEDREAAKRVTQELRHRRTERAHEAHRLRLAELREMGERWRESLRRERGDLRRAH